MSPKSNTMAEQPDDPAKPPAGVEDVSEPQSAPPQSDPISDLFVLDAENAKDADIQDVINRYVSQTVSKHAIATEYNVLFLHDSVAIGRSDADRIYGALADRSADLPILLIIKSPGGDVAAAYLIAKLCREYATGRFDVALPREAKSAATLIACGADRIHMGSLSELGPIDPQFGQIPALALKNSVEHLATLVQMYPQASDMFAAYLSRSLRVEALGFYERVAESAVQYAIRLLEKRGNAGPRSPSEIATTLVYDYKDHGFVIDAAEAARIFGNGVVVLNTPEYELANAVYNTLDVAEWLVGWRFARDLAFTGAVASGCSVRKKKQE
jgi:hypothetical protein